MIPTTPAPAMSTNVAYVDTAGNNSTAVIGNPAQPFADPIAAAAAFVTASATYGMIQLGAGTFDISALVGSAGNTGSFNLPNGISLAGVAPDVSIIKSTGNAFAAILNPGGNQTIQNLTVQGDPTAGNFSFPIGAVPNIGDLMGTDVEIYTCNFRAWSDAVYFKKTGSPTVTPISYTFYDSGFFTNYDTVNNQNATWSVTSVFNYCTFNVKTDASNLQAFFRGLAITSGTATTMTANFCTFNVDGTAAKNSIGADQRGTGASALNLFQCQIFNTTSGGTTYSIEKTGAGSVTVTPGTWYNPAQTNVTSGSITVL